ncbi:uncharacterized protein [Hoplias malabaricus]|uniref:uncharacterized protein n=1 Tax=Hoplias malabaricus TaxID=27720 RepID=UPI0034623947
MAIFLIWSIMTNLQPIFMSLCENGHHLLVSLLGRQLVDTGIKTTSDVSTASSEVVADVLNQMTVYGFEMLASAGIDADLPVKHVTPEGVILITKWALLAVLGFWIVRFVLRFYWIISVVMRLVSLILRMNLKMLKIICFSWFNPLYPLKLLNPLRYLNPFGYLLNWSKLHINWQDYLKLPSNLTEQMKLLSNLTERLKLPSNLTERLKLPSNLTERLKLPSNLTEHVKLPSNLTERLKLPSNLTEHVKLPSNPLQWFKRSEQQWQD